MITKLSWTRLACIGVLSLILVVSTGCKSKKDPPLNPAADDGMSSSNPFEDTNTTGLPDLTERLFNPSTGLQTVYFDYNSYSLRADAREVLKRNAQKIKEVPTAVILIGGHTDERGTQEYNFALGEKRALATREYLISLGVSGDRVSTTSFGEEMPAIPGSNEGAWSQNRRCEFSSAGG